MSNYNDDIDTENNTDDNVLHISNLSRNVKSDHLKEIFSSYGIVKSIEFDNKNKFGISKGSAYIHFETASEAQQAMIYMDGGQLDGLVVKLSFVLVPAKKRRDNAAQDEIKVDRNDSRKDYDSRRDFRGPRDRDIGRGAYDRYGPPRNRSPSPGRSYNNYNRGRPIDNRDRPYRPQYGGRPVSPPYRRRSPPKNDYRPVGRNRSRERRSLSPVRRRDRSDSVDRRRYSRSRSNNRRRSPSYSSSDSSRSRSRSHSRSKSSSSSRSSSNSSKSRDKSVVEHDKSESDKK